MGLMSSGQTVIIKSIPFPSWMHKLMQACMPACGLADPTLWPNSCILNCYADGKDGVDWHSDDESLFGGLAHTNERIISLALGSERLFEVRPKVFGMARYDEK